MTSVRAAIGSAPRARRDGALTLGVLIVLLVGAVLFPGFPARTALREGMRAPWTLTAPRAVSSDSEARTAARRASTPAGRGTAPRQGG